MEPKKLHKVLIVDDDEDILIVAKFALAPLPDLKVTCVNSGEEALQVALKDPPDLILLDLMMPSMDGVATLKAIRLIPSLAHIPIIFFTARVQSQDLENYKRIGAADVIIKPFDPVSFPTQIQEIWRLSST